jgi:hypothetical protein
LKHDPHAWFPVLVKRLERWSHLGDRRFDTGGRVIGHVPIKGPNAYLHRLYPPLAATEIEEAEASLGRTIPTTFKNYLSASNGASVFFYTIAIYRYIKRLERKHKDVLGQPIGLRYGNVAERASGVGENDFCIGSITGKKLSGRLYMDSDGGICLFGSLRKKGKIVSWKSFGEMMLQLVDHIGCFYDSRGDADIEDQELLPAESGVTLRN